MPQVTLGRGLKQNKQEMTAALNPDQNQRNLPVSWTRIQVLKGHGPEITGSTEPCATVQITTTSATNAHAKKGASCREVPKEHDCHLG